MNKWELARYFIDAKKCVDTMLFLSENAEKVSMIDIRGKVSDTREKFYINCCVVLDKSFPKDKKRICKTDIINSIYYERDKNFAHKDEGYQAKQYNSLLAIAKDMQKQLLAVKELCKNNLPEQLTVDFVPFDSDLFRLANGITKEKEEKIMALKYPLRDTLNIPEENALIKKIFSDTEDIKYIPEKQRKDYGTIFRMGICMEESLQHLQDDCIKTNVLFGDTNMWISIDFELWNELRKAGLVKEFDIPVMPKNKKELDRFMAILESIFPTNKR